MTKRDQRRFVRELVMNVRRDLLKQVALFPAEWDGHEIRQFIADTFQASSYTLKRMPRRLRDYRNAVLIMGRVS